MALLSKYRGTCTRLNFQFHKTAHAPSLTIPCDIPFTRLESRIDPFQLIDYPAIHHTMPTPFKPNPIISFIPKLYPSPKLISPPAPRIHKIPHRIVDSLASHTLVSIKL